MSYVCIGLGNPGTMYNKSRHNAGFCVIQAMLQQADQIEHQASYSKYHMAKLRHGGQVIYVVQPSTYMNLSGLCLADVRRRTGVLLNQLVVVCDNMDLPLGKNRFKFSGGSAGQKGLKSIIESAGSTDFWRLYIGIDRPKPPMDVPSYVLGRFDAVQEPLFLQQCTQAAVALLQLGQIPMDQIHTQLGS
jgi:PTH1 family peptidyl-tRNA hydrolase